MPRNVCSICGNSSEQLFPGLNGNFYCHSCIKQLNMVKCVHDGCEKFLKPEEAHLSGKGFLCEEHWNNEYGWCSHCGALIIKRYSHRINDETLICEHCFESSYFICEDCGLIYPLDKCIEIEIDGRLKKICNTCREDLYSTCHNCGNLTMNDNFIRTTFRKKDNTTEKINACRTCVEKVAHQCSHCGDWFENSIPLHDENT